MRRARDAGDHLGIPRELGGRCEDQKLWEPGLLGCVFQPCSWIRVLHLCGVMRTPDAGRPCGFGGRLERCLAWVEGSWSSLGPGRPGRRREPRDLGLDGKGGAARSPRPCRLSWGSLPAAPSRRPLAAPSRIHLPARARHGRSTPQASARCPAAAERDGVSSLVPAHAGLLPVLRGLREVEAEVSTSNPRLRASRALEKLASTTPSHHAGGRPRASAPAAESPRTRSEPAARRCPHQEAGRGQHAAQTTQHPPQGLPVAPPGPPAAPGQVPAAGARDGHVGGVLAPSQVVQGALRAPGAHAVRKKKRTRWRPERTWRTSR